MRREEWYALHGLALASNLIEAFLKREMKDIF